MKRSTEIKLRKLVERIIREETTTQKVGTIINFRGDDNYGISPGKYKITKVYKFEGDWAYDIENTNTREKHTHINPDLLHSRGQWK